MSTSTPTLVRMKSGCVRIKTGQNYRISVPPDGTFVIRVYGEAAASEAYRLESDDVRKKFSQTLKLSDATRRDGALELSFGKLNPERLYRLEHLLDGKQGSLVFEKQKLPLPVRERTHVPSFLCELGDATGFDAYDLASPAEEEDEAAWLAKLCA